MGLKQVRETYMDNFYPLNRCITKYLGLELSSFLEVIMYYYHRVVLPYADDEQKIDVREDYFFHYPIYSFREATGLSYKQIDRLLEKLKLLGIIETKVQDMPKKKYMKINSKEVEKMLKMEYKKIVNEQTKAIELEKKEALKKAEKQKSIKTSSLIRMKF